jgi:hypothetical protein
MSAQRVVAGAGRGARRALAWWLPLLAIGAACQPSTLRVESPRDGSQLTWMPLDVELRVLASAAVSTLEVELNGHDITARFAVGPAIDGWHTARAQRLWEGMVLPGANTLAVRVQLASGTWVHRTAAFEAVGDAFADALVSVQTGAYGGFPSPAFLPGIVLGPPRGAGLLQGGFDVYSLGFGGQIVVRFDDEVIVDGPGVDLTVFENAFLAENPATLTLTRPFADPGVVAVSQDGVVWHEFPCQLVVQPALGRWYPGCAGVYPVLANADSPTAPHASIPTSTPLAALIGVPSEPPPNPGGAGGDSFDLAEVGLAWARYVRIRDPDHWTGDPFGATNAGFDLDAIAAVHAAPATDADGNGLPDALE